MWRQFARWGGGHPLFHVCVVLVFALIFSGFLGFKAAFAFCEVVAFGESRVVGLDEHVKVLHFGRQIAANSCKCRPGQA
jgi:hypothetical protein